MIPQAQIFDVLRHLNVREGLFSEEEMNQLENGYSVSETDEERTNFNDELISMRSNITGHKMSSPGHPRSGSEGLDNLSPFFAHGGVNH